MSNSDYWAIVIGVNKYWSEAANLKFAVKDALDITGWLIDEDGGRVPPEQLFLLTDLGDSEHTPDGAALPAEITRSGATLRDLDTAMRTLTENSGGQGERLFFFYTGHGVSKEVQYSYPQESLLLSGFSADNNRETVTVQSIKNYFKALDFPDQFFIFDACRSLIPSKELINRDFEPLNAIPPPSTAIRPTSPIQYTLNAAAPLSAATEPPAKPLSPLIEANSAMTHVLLAGLKGAGDAKIYVAGSPSKYQVVASRLFKYVHKKVESMRIEVGPGVIQSPRYDVYASGSEEPVLAEIALESVDEVSLNVDVVPQDVWSKAAINLRGSDLYEEEMGEPILANPFKFPPSVFPMHYRIRAFAPGYEAKISPREVGEFYSSEDITITFTPNPSVTGLPPWRKVKDDLPAGNLVARSGDPLAPIEIRNAEGSLMAFGQGSVVLPDPQKEFYRIGIALSGNDTTDKIIELEDTDQKIRVGGGLPGDSNFFKKVVRNTNLTFSRNDNSLRLPDFGTIGAGGFSSPLIQAGLSLNGTIWNENLEEIGLSTLNAARERFMVIIADEKLASAEEEATSAGGADAPLSLKLSLAPQNFGDAVPVPLEGKQLIKGIGQFTSDLPEGNYVLSIDDSSGRNLINFPITLLTGRRNLLTVHRRADGRSHVYGFSVASVNGGDLYLDYLQQRRMELLQRFYVSGLVTDTHALAYANGILDSSPFDPLASCLASYTKIQLNKLDELGNLPERLAREYAALPDSHIIYAKYLAAQGDVADAVIAGRYRETLERGIPVFAAGAHDVVQAGKNYGLKDDRLDALEKITGNLSQNAVWTSWSMP